MEGAEIMGNKLKKKSRIRADRLVANYILSITNNVVPQSSQDLATTMDLYNIGEASTQQVYAAVKNLLGTHAVISAEGARKELLERNEHREGLRPGYMEVDM